MLYLIKTSKMICDGHFEYEELIGYDAKNRITFFTLYRKIRTAIDPYTFARGTVYGLVPLAVQEVWDKLEHLKEHISPADQEGDDDRMRQKAHIVAEYKCRLLIQHIEVSIRDFNGEPRFDSGFNPSSLCIFGIDKRFFHCRRTGDTAGKIRVEYHERISLRGTQSTISRKVRFMYHWQ